MPSGSVVLTEFSSWDPTATRRFMADVFGWEFRDMPGPMPYATASVAGKDIAGIRALMTQEPGPSSIPYLMVRNLTATLAAVEVQGGKILVPPTPVAKMGWFFWFQAPGGPVLACWQDDARAPAPKA
ncbi:MAG TPA: VOC family protein [Candidatus Thermoplasmatota archaeon]|nr:VOC family protein [Candidatus Thermoplasmatota archaeon]